MKHISLMLFAVLVCACTQQKQKETALQPAIKTGMHVTPCDSNLLSQLEATKNISNYDIFQYLTTFEKLDANVNPECNYRRFKILFSLLDTHTNTFLQKLDEVSPQAKQNVLKLISIAQIKEGDVRRLSEKVTAAEAQPRTKSEMLVTLMKSLGQHE